MFFVDSTFNSERIDHFLEILYSTFPSHVLTFNFAKLPANVGHSPNAVSMLVQLRRRCANIVTALGRCPVFAGLLSQHSMSVDLNSDNCLIELNTCIDITLGL